MTPAAALEKLAATQKPAPASTPSFTPAPSLLTPAPLPAAFGTSQTVTSPALTPIPARLRTGGPALTPPPAFTPAPGTLRPQGASAAIPSGKVKGTLVISRMKYLRARGEDDCERVLRRLPVADQQVLRGMLLPSSWYEANLVVRLETTIVALLSRGDRRELFLDMGRFTADTNLGPNGVQRPYLKVSDPHYLLRNVPRMYAAQHAGGVRTYEQLELKAAAIRTLEGEEPNTEDCLTAVGWLKRAVELAGGKIVTVEEKTCRGRGGACCEYVCRWI